MGRLFVLQNPDSSLQYPGTTLGVFLREMIQCISKLVNGESRRRDFHTKKRTRKKIGSGNSSPKAGEDFCNKRQDQNSEQLTSLI